jgi:hypothetical protein
VTALYCIAWAIIAAVTAWGFTITHCSAIISRLQEEKRREIAYWQDQTMRARATAAQIARDAETRADAWKQARDDVIAIMPLIASARDGSGRSQGHDDDVSQSA